VRRLAAVGHLIRERGDTGAWHYDPITVEAYR
jgi:hypothetical protein